MEEEEGEEFIEEELTIEEEYWESSREEEEEAKQSIREPFHKEEIQEIVKKEIETAIAGKTYSQKESKALADSCSNAVIEKIKNLGTKIKYLTHCLVLPANLTTFQCYSFNLWDELDDYVTVEVCNNSIRFLMTVWGVNCY